MGRKEGQRLESVLIMVLSSSMDIVLNIPPFFYLSLRAFIQIWFSNPAIAWSTLFLIIWDKYVRFWRIRVTGYPAMITLKVSCLSYNSNSSYDEGVWFGAIGVVMKIRGWGVDKSESIVVRFLDYSLSGIGL